MNNNDGSIYLSLDCEGLWGFCDILNPNFDRINYSSLLNIYQYITNILLENNASATFAVTGFFSLERKYFKTYIDIIENYANNQNIYWYSTLIKEWKERNGNGFHLPEIIKLIESNKNNNIWQHGLSHIPANFPNISEEIFDFEYSNAQKILSTSSLYSKGIIFPRNIECDINILKRNNLHYFRSPLRQTILPNRYVRYIRRVLGIGFSSTNIYEKKNGMYIFSSGNIPPLFKKKDKVLIIKYYKFLSRKLIKKAIHGEQVHIWFHPENLILNPTLQLFVEILFFELKKSSLEKSLQALPSPKKDNDYD